MAWDIRRCDEVDSTNHVCKTLAAQGADNTAVIARRQTAGKGRLGRSFLSPEGGLYLSVLWRGCPAGQLLTVTPLAAVAVCRAIEQTCGAMCGIKWCNDVVLNGKKLCGILTESSLRPDGGAEWLVVGIGVNVAQTAFPPDIADMAASLAMQGYSVSPDALAEVLAESPASCWKMGNCQVLPDSRSMRPTSSTAAVSSPTISAAPRPIQSPTWWRRRGRPEAV